LRYRQIYTTPASLFYRERLTYKAGCEYISDLHTLDEVKKRKAFWAVEKVMPEMYPLTQWNDALQYVVKADPEQTAEDAKKVMMSMLCS
jgi:hypothetical protein